MRLWDASAAVKLVVEEPGSHRARALYAEPGAALALDLTALEVASALWKRHTRGEASAEAILRAFETLARIDLELIPAAEHAGVALRIAIERRHPVYDCAYIALAADRGAVLVTADSRMRNLADSLDVNVVCIGPED